jgi:hypothetical protein
MGLILGVPEQPVMSASVSNGILSIESGEGGDGVVTIEWDRATANTDATTLDLKSHKLYVGTTSGQADVGSLDLSTTSMQGAVYVKITGLTEGTPYFIQVGSLNSKDVEGAKTELMQVPESAFTPSRSYTDISSTTTISTAGDYRITSSFTGKITISADNVYLNGQDNTITHSTDYGIEITGARDFVEIDSVVFDNTGTTNDNILLNTSSILNLSIHDCTGDGPGTDTCFIRGNDSKEDAGGAWIYNNTHQIDGDSGTARDTMFIHELSNFKSWNNTITMSNGGRDGGYSEVNNCVIWADVFTAQNPDQGTFISNRNQTGGIYIHNCTLTYESGQDNSHRMLFFDGDSNTACLWNTIDLNAGQGDIRAWRVRNTNGTPNNEDNLFGFNTVNCRSDGSAYAIGFGSNEGPATTGPGDAYVYGNTIQNATLGFELYDEWNGTLSSWDNTGVTGTKNTGLGGPGDWDTNDDSFGGTINTPASGITGTWDVNNGFAVEDVTNQTDHINFYTDTWQGYDPSAKTPNAPTNLKRAIQPFYPPTIDDRGAGNDAVPDFSDYTASTVAHGTGNDRYYQGTGGAGSFVRFGDTLYLYYVAGESLSGVGGDARNRKLMVRASTDDGATWGAASVAVDFVAADHGFDGPDSPDSEEGVFSACVTIDNDGLLIAFVGEMGEAGTAGPGEVHTQIGLWTSSNGTSWTRSQTIFDYNESGLTGAGDEVWPLALFTDGTNWHLYYSGGAGANADLNYIQSTGNSYTAWDTTSDSELIDGAADAVFGAATIPINSTQSAVFVAYASKDVDVHIISTNTPETVGAVNKTQTFTAATGASHTYWDQHSNQWLAQGLSGTPDDDVDIEIYRA